jgi:CHAT domain-containing protein
MVGKAREGFITLEQGRAQALLQLLALRGLEERLDDPSIWAAYEQVQTELQKAGKRLADASSTRDQAVAKHASERQTGVPPADSESGEAAVASAEVEREKAHSEYVRLRLELGFRLVDVRRAVPALRDDPVPLEDARRFLPSGSLWVAFAVGDADTLVFLVPATPGAETKAYIVPVTQVDLHERVSSLLRMVRQRPAAAKAARAQADRDLAASAHELYDLLFPEAVRPIVEKAAKLLISPDGVLWDLPFSALISNQQGEPQWLGLTKPLSYEQSLSAFVREGEKPRATGTKVLIAGNPTFGRREVTDSRGDIGIKQSRRAQGTTPVPPPVSPVDWTRGERSYFVTDGKPPTALPGTATEAIQVAALYGATPLLGSAATEPAVRKLIPYASVIHLATHGYFLPSLPMASGVMLATPEKEPEIGETDNDGVLQAFEFSGKLRLDANLVVLSACETGRGESVRGEGLIGLTRSLQIDGARTVVATHWRIDDRASSDLMVSFHRKVRNGIALDEALREAMAQVQRKPTTREPYYWAAFFLTGQRTPIAP